MDTEKAQRIIVITGASSGIGALAASALARAGHIVYAGIRDTAGRNASVIADIVENAQLHKVELRAVELDVSSQDSVDAAVERIISEQSRLDIVVHNAGHMVLGPAESFTPEDLAQIYDTNVIGTQRVNRAALPHLRKQGSGLLLWVGSSSTHGGCPPFLAPYFAAKAAMNRSPSVMPANSFDSELILRLSSPAHLHPERIISPTPVIPQILIVSRNTTNFTRRFAPRLTHACQN